MTISLTLLEPVVVAIVQVVLVFCPSVIAPLLVCCFGRLHFSFIRADREMHCFTVEIPDVLKFACKENRGQNPP